MMNLVDKADDEKLRRPNAKNSRERIISAARKVFAEQPYHIATIRMVGKAGGFDHQLVTYYFPTKAELFETIVAENCEEFHNANRSWFEGLDQMSIEDGFGLCIDRLLDYHFANPEPLRTVALNAHLIERVEEVPGHHHFVEFLAKTRATFEKSAGLARSEELSRFVTGFNTMITSYLGAAPSQAKVLAMDPSSDEYKTWIKETLIYVFLPLLKELILPE